MSPIGFCIRKEHLVAVKTKEFSRITLIEGIAQYGLRRIVILLMIQSIHTAEIRNSAFSGYTGSAKKDYIVIFLNDTF